MGIDEFLNRGFSMASLKTGKEEGFWSMIASLTNVHSFSLDRVSLPAQIQYLTETVSMRDEEDHSGSENEGIQDRWYSFRLVVSVLWPKFGWLSWRYGWVRVHIHRVWPIKFILTEMIREKIPKDKSSSKIDSTDIKLTSTGCQRPFLQLKPLPLVIHHLKVSERISPPFKNPFLQFLEHL